MGLPGVLAGGSVDADAPSEDSSEMASAEGPSILLHLVDTVDTVQARPKSRLTPLLVAGGMSRVGGGDDRRGASPQSQARGLRSPIFVDPARGNRSQFQGFKVRWRWRSPRTIAGDGATQWAAQGQGSRVMEARPAAAPSRRLSNALVAARMAGIALEIVRHDASQWSR
ncbi:hypothetical protein G7046_g4350 [Stylonectria norvegica]|nr:hypothetical protein G7046_g4350 [Stylonectria norvegica]